MISILTRQIDRHILNTGKHHQQIGVTQEQLDTLISEMPFYVVKDTAPEAERTNRFMGVPIEIVEVIEAASEEAE
jgi:hypothetical protein